MRLLVILVILSQSAIASLRGTDPSRYMIEINTVTTSEVDMVQFHKIASEIFSLYLPDAPTQDRHIKLNLDWSTPYFSAWAHQSSDKHYEVSFWGGLARIPGMLSQTWEFIACHEIGHVLAGEPRHKTKHSSWASSEGQSDHFAITECLPRYYKTFSKTEFDSTKSLPIELDRCLKNEIEVEDQNICLKILRAGRGFSEVLHYLDRAGKKASYETESKATKKTLYDSYPSAQCRIDTFYKQASCTKKELCQRNSCWFKPKQSSLQQ